MSVDALLPAVPSGDVDEDGDEQEDAQEDFRNTDNNGAYIVCS